MVDEFVSPAFRSHDWPEGVTGPQAFKSFYGIIRAALPDARCEIHDLIAADNKVVFDGDW